MNAIAFQGGALVKRGHRMHKLKRWLLPYERKVFTCRNKTACHRWHLASRAA